MRPVSFPKSLWVFGPPRLLAGVYFVPIFLVPITIFFSLLLWVFSAPSPGRLSAAFEAMVSTHRSLSNMAFAARFSSEISLQASGFCLFTSDCLFRFHGQIVSILESVASESRQKNPRRSGEKRAGGGSARETSGAPRRNRTHMKPTRIRLPNPFGQRRKSGADGRPRTDNTLLGRQLL